MADADLKIAFSADASGVRAGAADARAAILDLQSAVETAHQAFEAFRRAVGAAVRPPSADALKSVADQAGAAAAAAKGQYVALASEASAAQAAAAKTLAGSAAAEKDWTAAAVAGADERMAAAVSGAAAMEAANRRAAEASEAAWDRSVGSAVRTFSQGLGRMAEGEESFAKVVRQVEDRVVSSFADGVAQMVTHWLFAETRRTAATTAGAATRTATEEAASQQGLFAHLAAALKQITADAAKAAAGAYSAVAAIPIVGPFLAPEAAAAAFAGVMAFEGLASAAGGFDIPHGLNPITQLHQNEMVLPATIAQPLRGFLREYQQGAGLGGGRGGDTHISFTHAPTVTARSPDDIVAQLDANKLAFAKLLNRMARDGHFRARP